MNQKTHTTYLIIGIFALALATLACGSIGFGVVTPEQEKDAQPVNISPKTDSASAEPTAMESPPEAQPQATPTEELQEEETVLYATAWLGHIASLPSGSQYDDMVILSPEGTGEFGLSGATPEIEAEIQTLRDAAGPQEFVHLWGEFSCEDQDYNGCQLLVDKLQYGANYSEGEVIAWTGTIRRSTFNSGETFVFELSGDVPMWYSIYASQDEELKAQIQALSDSGSLVQVSGKLLVGIPDVNGTRIEVTQLEVLEAGTGEASIGTVEPFDPPLDWPVFVSDRYDYQVRYPQQAVISLFGPVGFSMDDVPADMTPEQYEESLQKEYTNQLCVQIKYSLGWIYIAAPPNKEKMLNPCGPTGLGSGEIIEKIETIPIGERLYQAKGVEFKLQVLDSEGNPYTGENLDLHGEMFRVVLENGFVIRFGTSSRHDANYEDYIMKTKDTLLQIIRTFETLP